MFIDRTSKKRLRFHVVSCAMAMLAVSASCQQQEQRTFDNWRLGWEKYWHKDAPGPTTTSPPAPVERPRRATGEFDVWVLDCTGSDECMDQAWSYLDEMSPTDTDQWRMYDKNGLRVGVGQLSDWPTIKEKLEACPTKVRTQTRLSVGFFTPITILSDGLKRHRSLFYFTHDGKLRARDYARSKMQLTLTAAGRTSGHRVRIVLSPKIVTLRAGVNPLMPKPGNKARSKTIEEELEDFNIVVNIGQEEFAMVGPRSGELSSLVTGSQLFSRWDDGQRHVSLILLKPAKGELIAK